MTHLGTKVGEWLAGGEAPGADEAQVPPRARRPYEGRPWFLPCRRRVVPAPGSSRGPFAAGHGPRLNVPKPLAVQLYTFRDPDRFGGAGLGLDPPTLDAIAAIGYLGVETVDVPGGDPVAGAPRPRCGRSRGDQLAYLGQRRDPDGFERAAGAVAALGSRRIIVSGSGFDSVAAVDAFADALNAASRIAGRHGLSLGYHNHSAEMRPVEGIPVYRRLLARLDPAIVFQIDVFWVVVGGAVPADVIAELGDRVVSLHVKDGVELPTEAYDAEPFVNVAVGSGVVDLASAVAAADRSPSIDWLIVEFDHVAGPPIDAVRDSYDHLIARGLARGRGA